MKIGFLSSLRFSSTFFNSSQIKSYSTSVSQHHMASSALKHQEDHRQFISIEPPPDCAASLSNNHIRILTYNVLAAASAESGFFKQPETTLAFHHRAPKILSQIQQFSPSIVCLQEADHIKEFYGPSLAKLGFDHVHVCRTGKSDGEGIWYDRSRWFCRASFPVMFADIEPLARKQSLPSPEQYSSPNVAMIAILDALQPSPQEHSTVVVGSIHLWWKPEDTHLRQTQIRFFFKKLKAILKSADLEDCPVLLAGDFNAPPHSRVYNIMNENGFTSSYHYYPFDANEIRTVRTPKADQHKVSPSATKHDAPFTSVNGSRIATIGIFFILYYFFFFIYFFLLINIIIFDILIYLLFIFNQKKKKKKKKKKKIFFFFLKKKNFFFNFFFVLFFFWGGVVG